MNLIVGKVKQFSELKIGIMTQCIKGFTVSRKLFNSTLYCLLLKINTKLNGTNHVLDDTEEK